MTETDPNDQPAGETSPTPGKQPKKDNNRLAHSFMKKNAGCSLPLHQLQENFKEWSRKVIQGHKSQDNQ